jgi:transcription elongation factor Elf1
VTRPAMTCPRCGTEMNHQAEKLVQPVTAEEVAAISTRLDGVLERVFACPNCGWIGSRRETGESSTPG